MIKKEDKKAVANLILYAILGIIGFALLGGLTWLVSRGLLMVIGTALILVGAYGLFKNTLGTAVALTLLGAGLLLVFNPYDITRFFGNMKGFTIADLPGIIK